MKQDLSTLREMMKQEEKKENFIYEAMKKVSNNWEARKNILSYYQEHDEIEKVETNLTKLQTNVEMKNYDQGIEDLDSCSFMLEHLQDKESLQWKNIF